LHFNPVDVTDTPTHSGPTALGRYHRSAQGWIGNRQETVVFWPSEKTVEKLGMKRWIAPGVFPATSRVASPVGATPLPPTLHAK
jgi:hypothetical protein